MRTLKVFAGIVSIVALLTFTSCGTIKSAEQIRTVSVSGSGMVKVSPDTATFSVSVSELGNTTAEARELVNSKIAEILDIIESNGIDTEDLTTMTISFNPEYEWIDSRQTLKGQRAYQSISVKVRDIEEDTRVLAKLFDDLGSVDNISVSSISFSREDTGEAYAKSRMLAVQKALQKATDYATASKMVVGKPLMISDSYDTDVMTVSPQNMYKAIEAVAFDSRVPTEIPTGDLEIVSNVSIVYEME
ncbi:MAG: SIMPL domain-containing protein [Spirochaetales bacterium]|jgi:hypothetical protein|nr:SIMPL domain-containing protein [Spirochaetales bacterium]